MTTQLKSTLGLLVASLFLVSCATHTVKSTSYTPVVQGSQDTPEYLLLDVGVAIFDPGLDEIKNSEEEVTNHEIRVAESRYAPFLLSETLQRSGNWALFESCQTKRARWMFTSMEQSLVPTANRWPFELK